MKISQFIMALGIAGASVAGFGGIADASPVAPATDVPVCVDGALSLVTDDNGVQHLACVASAVEEAPPALPAKAATIAAVSLVSGNALPASTPTELPRTGTGTDGLVIAALLVASGSVASLLTRRRKR